MTTPTKAYKNLDFLTSPAARPIRVLCELSEPKHRFLQHRVFDTVIFFGSARAKPLQEAKDLLAFAKRELQTSRNEAERARLQRLVIKAERVVRLSRYYDETVELARRVADWDMKRGGANRYYVATGGGPGIMEAANRGASLVPGSRSIGLGISLPFEAGVNPFVSKGLDFEFHYFFTRKYWFLYLAKAMVAMPGGFGTMDELFEVLTLRQTGKVKKPMPTVLFGTEYWDSVLDMQAMADWGTISDEDLLLFHRTDDVDDAFDYLVAGLEAAEREAADRGVTGPVAIVDGVKDDDETEVGSI